MSRAVRPGGAERPSASVSYRLLRAFGVYVLLLLVVGGVGVASVATVSTTRATEVRQQRLGQTTAEMLLAMTAAQSSIRGYRLTGDPVFLEPYDAARLAFPRQVATASSLADSPQERDLLSAQEEVAWYWLDELVAPIAASTGQSVPTPAQARLFRTVFDRYAGLNAELGALADAQAAAANAEAQRAGTVALVLSVAALLLSLGVAVVVHRRLQRALVTPLGAVVTTLCRLSAGRHDARADAAMGPHEVQVVAASLNRLADEAGRLRAEQATTARFQGITVAIGRDLRDEVVAGDPIATTLRLLGEVLGVDRVYVRVLSEDGRTEEVHQWQRPPWAPMPPPSEDAAYERMTASRLAEHYGALKAWVCEDTALRAEEDPFTARLAERTGARSALAVPVGAGGTPLGALMAMTLDRPRAWTPDEEQLMTSVAADLGRALVVRRLLEDQERLVDQLRALDRTKTEFLSTVSHELRTPLTSIAGYVEMVREGDAGEVPPEMDAMLVVVERNTARLRQLIEDLLTLSRIESGTYRVTHEEVCVAQVVAMVAQSLRPAADKARVAVHLEVDPGADAALVSGDPGQLERAVTNLVSNAVKFTPAAGRVRLALRAVEDRLVLEVADTGIGIPAAEQGQLFSRFFRASNASELAIPGTGLGLTIVRSIVEHHGGTLVLASQQGEGTTVTMDLPRLAGPASEAAALASRATVAAAAASPHHHEGVGAR